MVSVNETIDLTNKSFLELNIDEKYLDHFVRFDLLEEEEDYIENMNVVLINLTINDRDYDCDYDCDYRLLHGFIGNDPHGLILNDENVGMCRVGAGETRYDPTFFDENLPKQIRDDVKEIFDWYNQWVMFGGSYSYPDFLFPRVKKIINCDGKIFRILKE